jgi:hypothetical protein
MIKITERYNSKLVSDQGIIQHMQLEAGQKVWAEKKKFSFFYKRFLKKNQKNEQKQVDLRFHSM